jgi:hypothetical protein
MGFKVDTSFLRFLTMGALASQRVMSLMAAAGLQPIELERYSTSNKIWSTKVKRLRLPDLLCAKTGLRVEVRAKSDLAIRMSDAPANVARRWHSGLRPDDLIAFVHCSLHGGTYVPADNAECFWVGDIQDVPEAQTRLGPPKSAGEGSERDRVWASIVATKGGVVVSVDADNIKTRLETGRAQTYRLRGMTPYVDPGYRFQAEREFLAGLPARKASFSEVTSRKWDPRVLANGDSLDQFVCAKALGVVGSDTDVGLLERLYETAADERVSLESAGSMAKLGARVGIDRLLNELVEPRQDYLRMEAAFMLSELRTSPCVDEAVDALVFVAGETALAGDEVRQAAVWGLGQAGLRSYASLLNFLDAESEDERIHAVVAFGPDLPDSVVDRLVDALAADDVSARYKSSCVHVLSRLSNTNHAVERLCGLALKSSDTGRTWARAALGSMAPTRVQDAITDQRIRVDILPLQLMSAEQNWIRSDTVFDALNFIQRQTVFGR